MTKQIDTVTFHYTNGKPYTIKNVFVDCWVDWGKMTVRLLTVDNPHIESYVQKLTDDCIAVVCRGTDYVTQIWENPAYNLSVKVDVMTAKQGCKKNNKAGKLGKLIKEITEDNKHSGKRELVWEETSTDDWSNKQCYEANGEYGTYCIVVWSDTDIDLYLDGNYINGNPIKGTVEELKAIAQKMEDGQVDK